MLDPAVSGSTIYCPSKVNERNDSPRPSRSLYRSTETDSIRFQGNQQESPSSASSSKQERSWRERFTEFRQTKYQQFSSWAEKQYNWWSKQATKVVMAFAAIFNGLPLPGCIRKIIERRYFFSPPKVSSRRLIDQDRFPDLRKKVFEIKFPSGGTDSHELAAWYIPAKAGKPTVIFSHGRASNISDLAPILQALSGQGYGVFAYDYPGFGNSEGTPTEENLYEAGVAACKFLAGEDNQEHILAKVPYNQQILMGHSLGGAVAIDIAKRFAEDAKQKDPKKRTFNLEQGQPQALVVVNTFTDIKSALTAKGQDFHWTLQRLFSAKNIRLNFNSAEKIPEVNMPILVLHGDKDNDVSKDMGNELFMNIRDTKKGRFEILPDTKHSLKTESVCEQIANAITRFLKPPTPSTSSSMV